MTRAKTGSDLEVKALVAVAAGRLQLPDTRVAAPPRHAVRWADFLVVRAGRRPISSRMEGRGCLRKPGSEPREVFW